jgi:pyruvate, water dikinase
VAVRSSAVGEDSEDASFAGQQETRLWVRGEAQLAEAVRSCWASLYSAEAIRYRTGLGPEGAVAAMGVTVQLMVDAAVAGVLFTCNPVSGDPSVVAIDASWGLGQSVVGGEVTPDQYVVSKVTGELVRTTVGSKTFEYVAGPDGPVAVGVDALRASERCLSDDDLAALVELARTVQRHFGRHQDIEWAIDRDGALFVLQARPVTAAEQVQGPTGVSAMSLIMNTFGAGGGRGR